MFLSYKLYTGFERLHSVMMCVRVNPVTGRFEEDKPKPWEGMSEEQKEYEAMKLVNAMDKLARWGTPMINLPT